MRRMVLFGLLITAGCTPATEPSIVAGIALTNNASSSGVFAGDQFQITATPYDASGEPLTLFAVTFTSSNPSVATIDSTGLVDALAAGTTKLQAKAGRTSSGQYLITVDGNVTGTIIVTPNTPSVTAGSQVQLTATVMTTVGNPARGKSVTWSTSDASKATVDASGNVSTVAATSAVSICATAVDAPTVKSCATVTVR
jgi:uncharacterized protein YjdB